MSLMRIVRLSKTVDHSFDLPSALAFSQRAFAASDNRAFAAALIFLLCCFAGFSAVVVVSVCFAIRF